MNRDDTQDREMQALRKTNADMETLIDSSPVGAVVFDGRKGAPVTVNQEMKRIVAWVAYC